MSQDLMSLNASKASTVLSCKIGVGLKGKFTLLADENHLNVNQMLARIVEEAVDKKHEKKVKQLNKETDELKDQISNFQKQSVKQVQDLSTELKKLRQDYKTISDNHEALKKEHQKVNSELQLKNEELRKLKMDLTTFQGKYGEVIKTNHQWDIAYSELKEQFENSEQQLESILNMNNEIINKCKALDSSAAFKIRDSVWRILSQLPLSADQINDL